MPNTLVEHWEAEVAAFTKRKADADDAKKAAAQLLETAKTDLAAEDKVFTDLTKEVADTRSALAKAGAAEAAALAQTLAALIVQLHNSEGHRRQLAQALEAAQVEADVVADAFADAAAGAGEASGKLTAAQAEKKKRDERAAGATAGPVKAAVARAAQEGPDLIAAADKKLEVVPAALRNDAAARYAAEVAALQKAARDAVAAEGKAGAEAEASGGTDGAVVEKARAFARAEDALRAWLATTVSDVDLALASLKKVKGDPNDPPLLSQAEQDALEPPAPPVPPPGTGGPYEAPPTAPGLEAEQASALEGMVEPAGKPAPRGAAPAAPAAAKDAQDRLEALVPDRAWQAILDVLVAKAILQRVKDGNAKDGTPVADLLKNVGAAETALAGAKAAAALHRRAAEDLKYAARRTEKLLEKAQAAHDGRLLSAVRGDF